MALEQPLFMRDLAGPYASPIRMAAKEAPDIVDQGILIWNVIHHVIARYRKRHPEWAFARHEDLSADPVGEFGKLYAHTGLDYTDALQSFISGHSGAGNPAGSDDPHEIRLNSRENLKNWKKRLTETETERIRQGTQAVAEQFYGDDEW